MPCACEGTCSCPSQSSGKTECPEEECCQKSKVPESACCSTAQSKTCSCGEGCKCISGKTCGDSNCKAVSAAADSSDACSSDIQKEAANPKCGSEDCKCPPTCSIVDSTTGDKEVADEKCCCYRPDAEDVAAKTKLEAVESTVPSIDSEVAEPQSTQETLVEIVIEDVDRPEGSPRSKPVEEEMAMIDRLGERITVDLSCGIDDASSEATSTASEDVASEPVDGRAPLAAAEEDPKEE